eukprot:403345268
MNQTKELLKTLGLFNLPPTVVKKSLEQKKQEQLIQSQYKDFFSDKKDGDEEMLDEEERQRRQKEKEHADMIKKRDQHLMQLDSTKKLYINEIMRRANMFDITQYAMDFDLTEGEREQLELAQDNSYFKKLKESIKVEFDQQVITDFFKGQNQVINVIKKLEISEFLVRIAYIDKILKAYKTPILELTLNSTFITASECMMLGSNPRAKDLKSLDLSCNPISVQGLLYLISPKTSEFSKLTKLVLVNCDIDQSQTYMISNDRLENGKCQFTLQHLNLSHNNLNLFLNYVSELDLINPELQQLYLQNCEITDEQILNLIQSNKLVKIEHFDLSYNEIEKTFPLLMKYLKETCDYLQNFYIQENKMIKNSQTMQISKPKKSSGLPLLIRLDLSRSLSGDQHANQLAQSSYLKDLKYLNLSNCKINQKGFDEILSIPQMRSLDVLIFRKNNIRNVEGPYSDLEEIDDSAAKKGVMKLSLLDLRENKLQKIFLKDAVNFLKDTVVLMWDNPFDQSRAEMCKEFYDPGYLFRATSELDDDIKLIQNPLHIYQASQQIKTFYNELLS